MTESKREASVRLWRICFKDPEPFIELYFHKVFREDYTLLQYSETGEAVAHLQMLPYQLRIFGTSFSAGYISGACTHRSSWQRHYAHDDGGSSFSHV